MDLHFTTEERRFRDDLLAFLREAVSDTLRTKLLASEKLTRDELAGWHQVLESRGWAAPHWPIEWGGQPWSPVKQYMFRECLHLAPAPEPHVQNVNLIGPVIAAFASEGMKRRFLPGIRTLQYLFCQGFSEPNAGSDLASLRTRAERRGDRYVVNGQKVWTTSAHMADWMFCLARTSSAAGRHEGISYLLIEMGSPGVTVRPIRTIDGQHHLNEVFLESVEVPADQLVGEEGKGWDYSRFLLAQERLTIARVGVSQRNLLVAKERLCERAGEMPHEQLQVWTRRIAALETQVKALEITNLRALAAASIAAHVPSILKLRGAELQQATSELLLDLTGPDAWGGGNPAYQAAARSYLHLRAASIYGGSNEVQRNLVARALLA